MARAQTVDPSIPDIYMQRTHHPHARGDEPVGKSAENLMETAWRKTYDL